MSTIPDSPSFLLCFFLFLFLFRFFSFSPRPAHFSFPSSWPRITPPARHPSCLLVLYVVLYYVPLAPRVDACSHVVAPVLCVTTYLTIAPLRRRPHLYKVSARSTLFPVTSLARAMPSTVRGVTVLTVSWPSHRSRHCCPRTTAAPMTLSHSIAPPTSRTSTTTVSHAAYLALLSSSREKS